MKNLFTAIVCLLFYTKSLAQPSEYRHKTTLDTLVFSKNYRPEDPGFSVIVIEKGRIVYERQTGMANLKKGLPITSATMFNIGSVTKQFTAACIFLLEERGQLRRSDPVQKHLPELPDFAKNITLDHLISHTSGIPDHLEILGMQSKSFKKQMTPEAAIRWVQNTPILSFEPGSDFAYCNTGYMLLAAVVERVSGQKIHDFATENIFRRLGMTQTNFFQKEKDGLPDGTVSYLFDKKTGKFKHKKPAPNAIGATGVQSTLRDMARWDANFYQNKIGNGSLIKTMETPHFLNDGGATNYGGGLFLQKYRGLRSVAHTGGWNNFLMDCRQFPDLETTVMVASNNDFTSPFSIADKICAAILPLSTERKFSKSEREIQYCGLSSPCSFSNEQYISNSNFVRSVRMDQEGLTIIVPSNGNSKEYPLRCIGLVADSLLLFEDVQGDTATFLLDVRNDSITSFLNARPCFKGFWWTGGHFIKVRRFYTMLAHGSEVKKVSGKYISKSPRQQFKVKRDRRTGELVLKPYFFLKYPLESISGDVFRVKGENIILRFQKDGLLLGNDWVNNLPMKKIR